jgi:hypothetical protein
VCVCVCGDRKMSYVICFCSGKPHNRHFPRVVKDNFGIQNVEAPSKNPLKCSFMWFARKKITSRTVRISGTVIVILYLCRPSALVYSMYCAIQRRNLPRNWQSFRWAGELPDSNLGRFHRNQVYYKCTIGPNTHFFF